jgi:hypothetical protein
MPKRSEGALLLQGEWGALLGGAWQVMPKRSEGALLLQGEWGALLGGAWSIAACYCRVVGKHCCIQKH